jgi:hypothetical protein
VFKVIELDAKSQWRFVGRRTRTATLLVLRDTHLIGHRVGHDLLGAVQAQSRTVIFCEGERVKAFLRPDERAAVGDLFTASNECLLEWLRPEIQNRIARLLDQEWATVR